MSSYFKISLIVSNINNIGSFQDNIRIILELF